MIGVDAIHQLLPTLGYGDAIGNYAMALRRAFRAWGLRSDIFAGSAHPKAAGSCRPSSEFAQADSASSIVMLHYSIYSPELELFKRSLGRRLVSFHNVTPARYFLPWSLRPYYLTDLGRSHLRDAVQFGEFLLTVSEFNRAELLPFGGERCRVIPLVVDVDVLDALTPRAGIVDRYRDGTTNILFVGRVAPNKRHDDVIRAFAEYHRAYHENCRLLLVGGWDGLEGYQAALVAQARDAGLADRVVFVGHVDDDELVAYYRAADVFLCLSEHEGYCVPLLEAMHMELPVIARAAGAVPETLGGAGILLDGRDFHAIAAAIHRVVTDRAHRRQVLLGQWRRLRELAPDRVLDELARYLGEIAAA